MNEPVAQLQRAVPLLSYEDVGAAGHARRPGPEYRSPARHEKDCEQARRWLAVPSIIDGVLIYVGDIEGQHA